MVDIGTCLHADGKEPIKGEDTCKEGKIAWGHRQESTRWDLEDKRISTEWDRCMNNSSIGEREKVDCWG